MVSLYSMRVLLLVLLAGNALPAFADDPFRKVRELIQAELENSRVPSIAVAVARDGRVLWEEGFGFANRADRIPATARTMYSLASVSKPLTATGLMVLVERGLVRLDEPVNSYLGPDAIRAYTGDANQATVRQVAGHSAGLPLHHHFFYEDERTRPPSPAETIRRYGFLVYAPGERYQYSNLGYAVLGHLIATVSGASYTDFMRREVFEPLGMTQTCIPSSAADLTPEHALRYASDGTPVPFYSTDHAPASEIFSSVHDLVRFGMFHLGSGQAKPLAGMRRSVIAIGDTSSYGIGWRIDKGTDGQEFIWHSGGMEGVATVLGLIPSARVVIVVLSNARSDLPFRVTWELIQTLIPRASRSIRMGDVRHPRPRSFKLNARLKGEWSGRILTHEGEKQVALRAIDPRSLQARVQNQPWKPFNGAAFRDGRLTGMFQADLGMEETHSRPQTLTIDLRLEKTQLRGPVTVLFGAPGRAGNALTYWMELAK
jgi:CubicO group peptidase (beta-lactamase class C family)